MKDIKTILIAGLIVTVVLLVLLRGCGNQSAPDSIDIELIYDSLEREILSTIPDQVPDTIKVKGEDVIRWKVRTEYDTIWRDGQAYTIEVPAKVDTNAIIEHWKLDALAYSDTLEDDTLRAFIDDTIYQNSIVGRSFRYQLLMPVAHQTTVRRNVFQAHVMFSSGMRTDLDSVYRLSLGAGLLLEFKSGTGIGPKYTYTIDSKDPHNFELLITQRIQIKKPNKVNSLTLLN